MLGVRSEVGLQNCSGFWRVVADWLSPPSVLECNKEAASHQA